MKSSWRGLRILVAGSPGTELARASVQVERAAPDPHIATTPLATVWAAVHGAVDVVIVDRTWAEMLAPTLADEGYTQCWMHPYVVFTRRLLSWGTLRRAIDEVCAAGATPTGS